MTDIQIRRGWIPCLSVCNICMHIHDSCKQGVFVTVLGADYIASPVNNAYYHHQPVGKREDKNKGEKPSASVPPACPTFFRRMSSKDQIHGRNGRSSQVQEVSRAASTPSSLPGKVCQIDPRALDRGTSASRVCHPTPYQRIILVYPLVPIPVCASCPVVQGHGQAGILIRWAYAQPATATRMHNPKSG